MNQRRTIDPVRGMHALPPPQAERMRAVEQAIVACAGACGYDEIRLPLLEHTELFTRSIGEATDIVGKEMYSFDGRDGQSLSLRPEGTAGCIRAAIEQGLGSRRPARLWYCGPMFRYERPQKGRARQFFQFGAEALGMAGTEIEVELLLLCARIWRQLGVEDRLELELSTLGNDASRDRYRGELVDFLQSRRQELDEDSRERLHTNPLRVLDTKVRATQKLLEDAPQLPDFLDAESADRFGQLRQSLDDFGIAYRVNPCLVRGLDYYCHTVFEWVAADGLGAQNTLCAGGRYDGLAELLGGEALPATGFALGLDRLLLLEPAQPAATGRRLQFFVTVPSGEVRHIHLELAENLRNTAEGIRATTCLGGSSLRSQLKQADAAGADCALLAGERELAEGQVRARRMRDGSEECFATSDLQALMHWTMETEEP